MDQTTELIDRPSIIVFNPPSTARTLTLAVLLGVPAPRTYFTSSPG
jgi:hypothetical protein